VRNLGRIKKRLQGLIIVHMVLLLLLLLFHLFDVDFTCHNCPSVRCTVTANAISIDSGIFYGRSVLIRGVPKGKGAAGL